MHEKNRLSNHRAIEDAVLNALAKSKDFIYEVIRLSMQKAAVLPDNALVRKLVRVYYSLVERFPFYTQKRKDKDALKKEQETTAERKRMFDDLFRHAIFEYTSKSPAELDKILATLEEHLYLLNVEQESILNVVVDYLEYTEIHSAMLDAVDVFLLNVQKFIAQKPTDVEKINNRQNQCEAYQDMCEKIIEEQKLLQGQWILGKVDKALQELDAVERTLMQLLDNAEKKQEEELLLQSVNDWYEEQNIVMPQSENVEVPVVVPSLISKDYSVTPGSKRIQKERETNVHDVFIERNKE